MSDAATPARFKCYDCGDKHRRRDLREAMAHVDLEYGGYERIPVPMCPRCWRKRHGYDCPHCGCTYDTREDAVFCCERRSGEAPDCLECGRRMKRGAWGNSPSTGPTVEWAECECCPVAWGKYTGWHYTDDGPCKHVEADSRGEPDV